MFKVTHLLLPGLTVLAMVLTYANSGPIALATDAASPAATSQQAAQISNLQARGDREIDRRLASLNEVATKINLLLKLTPNEKTALTTQIQGQITSLTALKAKIDADTDLTTLRTDLQSVVKSYRIYAVYIPEIHILAAADRLDSVIDQLTKLQATLQTDIQSEQAQEQSVSLMESEISIIQSKLADAKLQSQNVTKLAASLTPQGYPTNKFAMQGARADLQAGQQDLVAALQQAKLIIQRLKLLGVKKPASASASSSAASTSAQP